MSVKLLELTIFAKKMQTKDGKSYFRYLTTLPREEERIRVKFREDAGVPKDCPCNILIAKGDCNLSKEFYNVKIVDEETGEVKEERRESRVLWVSAWTKSETVYVDNSMDAYFED